MRSQTGITDPGHRLIAVVHELNAVALVPEGAAIGVGRSAPAAIFALSFRRRNIVARTNGERFRPEAPGRIPNIRTDTRACTAQYASYYSACSKKFFLSGRCRSEFQRRRQQVA